LSIEAQTKRLEIEAQMQGWRMQILVDEGHSGAKSPLERPSLYKALQLVEAGVAEGIVVTKLDRIARSLIDLMSLLEQSKRGGWNLVALDLGINTGTPEGRLVAGIMGSIAEWERARISERITEALAAAKERGTHVGAPRRYSAEVQQRAQQMRAEGSSYAAIARALESEGATAKSGARLSSTQVRRMCESAR
jgi:DNA invertase Pin-like site-specific DNA recombinase